MKPRLLLIAVAVLLLGFVGGIGFSHWHFQKLCKPCIDSAAAKKPSSMTEVFADTSKVVIAGASSKDVLVECYNAATPRKMIIPVSVTVDSAFNVVVRFLRSTSGYCTVHNTK